MIGRRAAIIMAAVLSVAAGPTRAANAAGGGTWRFDVLLDDKPIGEHVFRVVADGDARTVQSDARFTVKLLGIAAYRYRHHATEQWRGDCLTALNAETDDDGEKLVVAARMQGDAFTVDSGQGQQPLPRCTLSFAYWNPAIRNQAALLNAQTGKLEHVQIARAGTGEIMAHGKAVLAVRWRITGTEQPIDVWYATGGQWVGLDSTVRGGRRLTYRLK